MLFIQSWVMLRAVPPGTDPLLSHPTKFGQADRGLNHLLLTRTSKQPGQITTEEGGGMASFSKMLIYPVVNFQISRCLWQAATLLSLLCKWTRSLSTLCLIVDASLRLFHICGYLIYVRAFNLFSARRCDAAAATPASWCTRNSGLV